MEPKAPSPSPPAFASDNLFPQGRGEKRGISMLLDDTGCSIRNPRRAPSRSGSTRGSRTCRWSPRTATPTRAGMPRTSPPRSGAAADRSRSLHFSHALSQGITLEAIGMLASDGSAVESRWGRGDLAAVRQALLSLSRHADAASGSTTRSRRCSGFTDLSHREERGHVLRHDRRAAGRRTRSGRGRCSSASTSRSSPPPTTRSTTSSGTG